MSTVMECAHKDSPSCTPADCLHCCSEFICDQVAWCSDLFQPNYKEWKAKHDANQKKWAKERKKL